jgi:hypothetical protein
MRSYVKLRSLRSSRLGAAAATAALAGAAVLVPASTAYASAPTVSNLYCDSWGAGQFFCSLTISGGSPPFSSLWFAGANVTGFGAQSADYTLGYCVQNQNAEISVIVRSSTGEAAPEVSTEFPCA